MGYTRNVFLGNVEKTVTISYPKSESGGTVSKTVSEPVYLDLHFDTDPFDRSVTKCDNSIDLLKMGIAAAELAEKNAREEAAARLGRSLNDGFFQLVTSNLTIQAKEELATAKSMVAALIAQQKELLKIKGRMEGDYNLITARYMKLFTDYDKELRNRILALDHRTFELVKQSGDEQMRPITSSLMTSSLIGQKENLTLQTRIVASRLKYLTSKLIDSGRSFIEGTNRLAHSLHIMLRPAAPEVHLYYLPVVAIGTSDDHGTVFAQHYHPAFKRGGAHRVVELTLSSPQMHWRNCTDDEKRPLTDEFNALVKARLQRNELTERVAATMQRLWQNNSLQVLGN